MSHAPLAPTPFKLAPHADWNQQDHGSRKLQEESADDPKVTQYFFICLCFALLEVQVRASHMEGKQSLPRGTPASLCISLGPSFSNSNQNINSVSQLDIVLVFSQFDTSQSHLKRISMGKRPS